MTDDPKDPAQVLAKAIAAGQDEIRRITSAAMNGVQPNADPLEILRRYPQTQQEFANAVGRFWGTLFGLSASTPQSASAATGTSGEKRLANEAWQSTPWADAVKRTYLAYSDLLQSSLDNAALDAGTKEQARFGLRQFIDAMNPANFLITNPEALEVARETNGQSVVEGVRLFFQDLAKGRISTTDESAFEVGRSVATTPGAVIHENELFQLIQYAPVTAEVAKRPLLVVPPCINRFYILDLQPKNSFVRYALERGHSVFMLSWRSATPELGKLTWDDYVEGVLRAIDIVLDVSAADRVNALGFCIGGTLLSSALAVMTARGESKVASLTLLTTMLDFGDAGELGTLISEQAVAAKEAAIGKGGILEGKELAAAFSSLRANDLVWQYVTNSYLKGKAPPAFDMLYWNADSSDLPGPMFCWYIRNAYLENKLRRPGGTVQCGVPVDLSQVHVPAFLYASRDDHIVPWKTAFASREILSGDTTFVLGASGHIAGVINHPALNKRNYWADGKKDGDAQRWLETAQSTAGSWWPRWAAWLAQHAGPSVPASRELGNRDYPPVEPAPGRYVVQKG